MSLDEGELGSRRGVLSQDGEEESSEELEEDGEDGEFLDLLDVLDGRADPYLEDKEDIDRKSTRLNSSHSGESRMPSSA